MIPKLSRYPQFASEVVVRRCSSKYVFVKISPRPATLLEEDSNTDAFLFYRTPPVAVPVAYAKEVLYMF